MSYESVETAAISAAIGFDCRLKKTEREIGLLVFPGFSFLAAGIMAEVFHLANAIAYPESENGMRYNLRLFSINGGEIACSLSAKASTDRLDRRQIGALHALFSIGSPDAMGEQCDHDLVRWLRMLYPDPVVDDVPVARRMSGDVAGLTSGRVTGPRLVFPGGAAAHTVETGTPAGGDARRTMLRALRQVRDDLGLDVATKVAEQLSPGSSSQWTPLLGETQSRRSADRIRASARWLLANCERPVAIVEAASVAAMSGRNFLRCFKRELGITPAEFLLQARLDVTRRLLATTNLHVDNIARCTGMRNGDRLAKMFRKRFAISPTEYRLRTQLGRTDGAVSLSSRVKAATSA
jgi:transcriptional regulator GlxA family with amidase domain